MGLLVLYAALVSALVFGPHVFAKLSTPTATPCTGTLSRTTAGDLVVPAGAVCRVSGAVIEGSVTVQRDAYFEASASQIRGTVNASGSLTVFLHDGTSVAGSVVIAATPQLFLYKTAVSGSVKVTGAVATGFGHVQVCATTAGRIEVRGSGPDVLIGDPQGGCPGNQVRQDVVIAGNETMGELQVSGNEISGSLVVTGNGGASPKHVVNNTVTGMVDVWDNAAPFDASSNG